jgi:hypothetical protein
MYRIVAQIGQQKAQWSRWLLKLRDFEVRGIRKRSSNASDLDSLSAHGSVGSGRRAAEIGTMRNVKVKKGSVVGSSVSISAAWVLSCAWRWKGRLCKKSMG